MSHGWSVSLPRFVYTFIMQTVGPWLKWACLFKLNRLINYRESSRLIKHKNVMMRLGTITTMGRPNKQFARCIIRIVMSNGYVNSRDANVSWTNKHNNRGCKSIFMSAKWRSSAELKSQHIHASKLHYSTADNSCELRFAKFYLYLIYAPRRHASNKASTLRTNVSVLTTRLWEE